MSTKLLVLVLVCILIFPLGLAAKDKRGADLVVQKKDGQSAWGELITVKDRSLLLLGTSGADVSVDISEIKTIRIKRKSRFSSGVFAGGLLGAAGFILGTRPWEGGNPLYSYLLIGGAGAFVGIDKTIQIEGKSDSEIQAILRKLRKKARVPNYN